MTAVAKRTRFDVVREKLWVRDQKQREVFREMEREQQRLQRKLQKEIVNSGPVSVGTVEFGGRTVTIVSVVELSFEGNFLFGRRDGAVIGPGTDLIFVDQGMRAFCGTSIDGEKFYVVHDEDRVEQAKTSRTLSARSLAVKSFSLMRKAFTTFAEGGSLQKRKLLRARAVSNAKACLLTLESVDPAKSLAGCPEFKAMTRSTSVLASPARARTCLSARNSVSSYAACDEKSMGRSLLGG